MILHLRGDLVRVAAFDDAVAGAGEQQQRGGAGAGAARRFIGNERAAPAHDRAPPAGIGPGRRARQPAADARRPALGISD